MRNLRRSRRSVLRALRFAAAAVALASGMAWAATTQVWTESTAEEFDKGKTERLTVDRDGRLLLAPALVRSAGIQSQCLWCVVRDSRGAVYAGGGSPGAIYRRQPGGEVQEVWRSAEEQVHCLAVDKEGNVYAGTSPGGVIYRIATDGQASVFHDAEDGYIWAMAFDLSGDLIAATGNPARIVRLKPDGKAEEVYRCREKHFVSLALGPKGDVYAGTAPNGLVVHIPPDAGPRVIYDADESEVRALALQGERLYVGTASAKTGRTPVLTTSVATPSATAARVTGPAQPPSPAETQTAAPAAAPTPSPSAPIAVSPTPARPAANAVYEIDLRLLRERRLLDMGAQSVLALAVSADGRLLVCTGDEGKILRITPGAQEDQLLLHLSEKQVLAVLLDPGRGAWLACANPGALLLAEERFEVEGTYTSGVHDGGASARWGRVTWRATTPRGSSVAVATRSGNSRQPDETWSAWSEDLPDPAGSQAASPSARFIQFRATLRSTQPDATPALDEVSVAYLPTNLPPDIQEVRREGDPSAQAKAAGRALDAAGRLARTPRTPSAPGTPAPTPALRRDPSQATIQWRASDPNGDRLTYKLEFRGVEERLWKPLAERLSETTYAWDTSSVPDGRYLVKVIASDEADNPAGLALQTERVSDAITVDNTRPFLKSIKVAVDGQGRATIEGVARDDFGHVARVEVSLDGGAWFAVAAADGIADSREESFHHTTAPLAAGEHCVVVRMTDNAENVGAGKAVFVVAATGVGR